MKYLLHNAKREKGIDLAEVKSLTVINIVPLENIVMKKSVIG